MDWFVCRLEHLNYPEEARSGCRYAYMPATALQSTCTCEGGPCCSVALMETVLVSLRGSLKELEEDK